MSRELLQQALEGYQRILEEPKNTLSDAKALREIVRIAKYHISALNIAALNLKLAKPEQEPQMIQIKDGQLSYIKKPWVRITGDEVAAISLKHGTLTKDDFDFAYAVEAKLKEKNNGSV